MEACASIAYSRKKNSSAGALTIEQERQLVDLLRSRAAFKAIGDHDKADALRERLKKHYGISRTWQLEPVSDGAEDDQHLDNGACQITQPRTMYALASDFPIIDML